jgi:heme exporter protein CcmD
MIDLGPHTGFIVLAYAGVALVTAGLIVWTIWRSRAVHAQLASLEAQGIRRRSDTPAQ